MHLDREHLIARRVMFEARDAKPLQTQHFVGLRAGRYFHHGRALQGRHFNLPTEHRCDETDRYVAANIIPFALEHGMWLDRNGDVEVAGGPAIDAVLALVGEAQTHAGFDASWNVDGDRALPIDALTALAGWAGLRDDATGSLTLAAGSADAEEALLQPDLPGTLAARTGLNGCG